MAHGSSLRNRGGRFVNGVSGEQFALPEAINVLRKPSKREKSTRKVIISSADPLNLVGILLPGDKIKVAPHRYISFVDGVETPTEITSLPIAADRQ